MRKKLSRIREIIRREGFLSLWFGVCERFYCRALYLECPLDKPLEVALPNIDYTIRLLRPEDAPAYVHYRRGAFEENFLWLLEAQQRCYAAFIGDRIASTSWIATRKGTMWMLDADFDLDNDVVYIYDSFTHPDFRGLRIQAAVFDALRRDLVAAGYRRAVTLVTPENAPNLHSRRRLGFKRRGMIRRLRLGSWTKFLASGAAPLLKEREYAE